MRYRALTRLGRAARDSRLVAVGSSQIPIIAVLVLIILGATVLGVYMLMNDGKTDTESGKLHLWCVETKKPYVLDADALSADEARQALEMGDSIRITNPDSGRATLIRMWQCLKCKEYFAPESWKTGQPESNGPTCPHCNTNQRTYGM